MKKVTCVECKGEGQLPAFSIGATTPTEDCPWCDGTGKVDEIYAIFIGGFNGDCDFRELWETTTSFEKAKKIGHVIMNLGRFQNMHDGKPTVQYVEVSGPGVLTALGDDGIWCDA